MTKIPLHSFVRFILQRLRREGFQACVVGGAVRDALLQRPVSDWDVATSAAPEAVMRIFAGTRRFEMKKGTVVLVKAARHFEVTTFRGSGKSLREDLAHRDFTINAMAYDPDTGEIADPFGGRADTVQRLVRAVGRPASRFAEDPVRLLRAVRFASELGFSIERSALETLTQMAPDVLCAAPERIRDELLKILVSPLPEQGFNLMRDTGLLGHILPELLEGCRMRQEAFQAHTLFKHLLLTVASSEPQPVLRLAALFHDAAKPRVKTGCDAGRRFPGHEEASAGLAEDVMTRLKFGRAATEEVVGLVRHHGLEELSRWTDGQIRRLFRRVGRKNVPLLLHLHRANTLAHGLHDKEPDDLKRLLDRVEALSRKPFAASRKDLALDGNEVMAILGLRAGPWLGKVLDRLVEIVTDHPERNTKEGLAAMLEEMRGLQSNGMEGPAPPLSP